VRELILTDDGPILTDIYSEQGEVLMGTLRWQKEAQEKAKESQRRVHFDYKRRDLKLAEAETHLRIKALQRDLERQRIDLLTFTDKQIDPRAANKNASRSHRAHGEDTKAGGHMMPNNGLPTLRLQRRPASRSAKKGSKLARKGPARMGRGARLGKTPGGRVK
jgi:hypothetical protein